MARGDVTGKTPSASADTIATQPKPAAARLVFNIPEFCEAFRISEDFFFKLKRQGQGPREMKIGKRTLISVEAANEWRIERERATAAQVA